MPATTQPYRPLLLFMQSGSAAVRPKQKRQWLRLTVKLGLKVSLNVAQPFAVGRLGEATPDDLGSLVEVLVLDVSEREIGGEEALTRFGVERQPEQGPGTTAIAVVLRDQTLEVQKLVVEWELRPLLRVSQKRLDAIDKTPRCLRVTGESDVGGPVNEHRLVPSEFGCAHGESGCLGRVRRSRRVT